MKRALDLILLLPTLPIFLSAISLLALVVLLLDGRPIFFTQLRAGKRGRRFRILKLRTMTTEADARDRRPTRFGAFMRQHGLDELPQLLNVLVGDMSLVGPRPLKPDDVERLSSRFPQFKARLEVPPGLTGLSQIALVTGAEKVAAVDAHYARTRSALLDLEVLFRTMWINVVGKRRGAFKIPRAWHIL